MELLNSSTTISSNHMLSPGLATIFSPKFPFKSYKNKAPSKLSIPNSNKFRLHPPFSLYIPLSSPSRFKLSAQFRRPPNRQNYLRKKLTQHKQVSPNSDFQNPVPKFIDNYDSGSNLHGLVEKSSSLDDNSGGVKEMELESKSKLLGGNVFWDKLENWVEQCKKDIEFWGVGTGPIFNVFQDSEGKVERVVVDEDEILRRRGVEPLLYKEGDVEDLTELNERISYAKVLAREMEDGNDVLLRNSSVVKYFTSKGKSGLVSMIQGVSLKPVLDSKLSRAGITVVCCVFVIVVVMRLISVRESKPEYTRFEKEIMRRKLKARMEKEKTRKGTVEVIQEITGPIAEYVERPQLDKEELMNSVKQAGKSSRTMVLPQYGSGQNVSSVDDDDKIQEIRAMARRVRQLERRDSSEDNNDGEDHQINELSNEEEIIQKHRFVDVRSEMDHVDGYEGQTRDHGGTKDDESVTDNSKDESRSLTDVASGNSGLAETSKLINMKFPDESERPTTHVDNFELDLQSLSTVQTREQSEASESHLRKPSESSTAKKFRVIQSVEEAREYLSNRDDNIESTVEHEVRTTKQLDPLSTELDQEEIDANASQRLYVSDKISNSSTLSKRPDSMRVSEKSPSRRTENFQKINKHPKTVEGEGEQKVDLGTFRLSDTESSLAKLPNETETDIVVSQEQNDDSKIFPHSVSIESSDSSITCGDSVSETSRKIPAKGNITNDVTERKGEADHQLPGIPSGQESRGNQKLVSSVTKENWLEKNFHEIEPIVKKIGVGFRDNYIVAKAKTNDDMNLKTDMTQLLPDGDGSELEWMKDERLRETVFKVRENEIAGRDPFHLMDDEDKLAFFSGLERKVEQENAKLSNLHEWVHSNIENLDYGADGISLYDPPEKIIPRWKGPPVEKIPEFLKNSIAQQKELVPENVRHSNAMKKSEEGSLQLSEESPLSDGLLKDSALSSQIIVSQNKSSKTSRTIIEGSDGSVKAAKKSGKEYWQHTKKWSQGFLESFNAETDPEVKAVMKDMGKDLDRWITQKEIKEAADLIDKLPERGQELIKEKLNKVKREMEVFGPQAVVSKYRDYADEKEDDYLWWLDLPYVLCIELYTEQEGEQKVGLYSLEMAADLELDPKQYHVIAFEDAGDCKNMCYTIQAHMEILGNGNAFVVARPPKDAFREAKANGFGVTVIRKGEMQLNVDQTLEEVEELIAELGSKIYHDTTMRERSVDISAVMKGVFGLKKPVRRTRNRLRRKLTKPANS
ncbi:hypothetical protein ACH5RR_000068 [Cinchona calisaya]|uniref:Embryo defective 1703 n=1 Tax=Cinchona calisaya TaxID=153742 RepID=A0ABD3AZL7_9GENT